MSLRYDAPTVRAIREALDDEYHARAAYAAIIERFGPVRPFVNIVLSEDRHASALERLLRHAGEPLPADRWAGAITPPDTLEEALALGVQAEIDNRDMYDRLEAMTDRPEVLRVFGNLRQASEDNHLTAFQRGLDRMTGGDRPGNGPAGGENLARSAGSGRPSGAGQGKGRTASRGVGLPDETIYTSPPGGWAGRSPSGRSRPEGPSGEERPLVGADRTPGFGGASGRPTPIAAGEADAFVRGHGGGQGCGAGQSWGARGCASPTDPVRGYGQGR